MLNRWKILIENIYVYNIVRVFKEEANSFTQENHRGRMGSGNKTKSNAQCFNRPMGLSRIFLNDNRNVLSHERKIDIFR